MKRYVFSLYILMSLLVFQLTATKKQTTVYIPLLSEIVTQSSQIINAQSSQARIEAKKKLVLLIKENRLDKKTRAKIAYAISIIVRTTAQTMQLSREAYGFLVALLRIQDAQKDVVAAVRQIQSDVIFSSDQDRQRVVDVALKELQSVTQEAQATVDNARVHIKNMMKLSEIAFEGDLSHLKNVIEKAAEIIVAHDERVRSEKQQEFTVLIKKLDKNIKDAIMPDLEIIQNTTDETLQKSQEAYDRLFTMIQIIDEEMTDLISILGKEGELMENEPESNFTKISNFVANQLSTVENFFQKTFYTGMSMMPLGYLEKQNLLVNRIRIVVGILLKSKNKDLLASAQSELKDLVQRKDLDDKIKKALDPVIAKINNKQGLISEDEAIVDLLVFSSSPSRQLSILDSIHKRAAEIVFSYLLGSSIENSANKNYIVTEMNEGNLYQKINDQIRSDVEIILNTTNDTVEQSGKALHHLGQIINEQRSYINRAEAMISNQTSKLWGLVPESVKKFIHDYPMITAGIVGGILGYIIREKVTKPRKNFVYNYKLLQAESKYFNGILHSLQKAAKEGDDNKYHVLMGVLEGLGLEFAEGWEEVPKGTRIHW